jgi:hypothetical protein
MVGNLGYLKEEIQEEISRNVIGGLVQWIKSVQAISDELNKRAIKYSSIVLNIKDNVAVQKMLQYRLRIAGNSQQDEI